MVSVVSPTVSSEPMARSSAARMRRAAGRGRRSWPQRTPPPALRGAAAGRRGPDARTGAGIMERSPEPAQPLPGGRPLDPERPAPDPARPAPDPTAAPAPARPRTRRPRAPRPGPRTRHEPPPGLRAQVAATKAAILALARAHLDLAKAELDEIKGEVARRRGAGRRRDRVPHPRLAHPARSAGRCSLGEWIFGSIGWGVLLGVELLLAVTVTALLEAVSDPGARPRRGIRASSSGSSWRSSWASTSPTSCSGGSASRPTSAWIRPSGRWSSAWPWWRSSAP